MDDWVVGQVNTLPSATALSVIAINQSDASKQFFLQPFLGDPIPPLVAEAFSNAAKGGGQAISWAPASVSVDPDSHLIYASDSLPGKIAAIKLTSKGLKIVWKANQTTTEFTALIGSKKKRVLGSVPKRITVYLHLSFSPYCFDIASLNSIEYGLGIVKAIGEKIQVYLYDNSFRYTP